MDLSKIFTKKNKYIFICLIVSLILELFVFNRRFWFYGFSAGRQKPAFYLEDGTPLEYGKSYNVPGMLTIISEDIDVNLKNIHVGIVDCNDAEWNNKDRQNVVHISPAITDEGHAQFYGIGTKEVSPLVPQSLFLPVEPFGKVSKVKLTITDNLDEIIFDSIELNGHIPFSFSLLRFALIFIILIVLYNLLLADYYDLAGMDDNKKRSVAITLLFVSGLMILVLILQNQTSDWGGSLGYDNLAKAISKGQFYVKENKDAVLAGMENPYDANNRIAIGAKTKWDTAFYNNKYYVYFGVVPVLVLFLPYYLLTGGDMSYMQAAGIIDVLMLIAGFLLIYEIKRLVSKDIPLRLFLLLSSAFTFSAGIILLVKRASIYYVAIGMGLVFVFYGLYFWFNALRHEVSLWRGAAGSLCMAAAVGCRPQFAIASFLGIYIFRDLFVKRWDKLTKLLILISPYVPVAAGLMYYNYARFGSPFDFGANYNLTGYDMVHMGVHLMRIPAGLWYYLFNLPKFNFEFPFMYPMAIVTEYPGFMVNELVIGGAIAMIPLSWLCISDFINKKKSPIRLACYVMALIVVIADTIMCGILVRYQLDYRLYLTIPAVMLAMETLSDDGSDRDAYNKRARLIAALSVATLFLCILTVLCQYENPDYSHTAINPVFFCRMKLFF